MSVNELEKEVHKYEGIFVLAHIDRSHFSIISQIGFIPEDLNYEAVELSYNVEIQKYLEENPRIKGITILRNSDAHQLKDIGKKYSLFVLEKPSFFEIKKAIMGIDNRKILNPV